MDKIMCFFNPSPTYSKSELSICIYRVTLTMYQAKTNIPIHIFVSRLKLILLFFAVRAPIVARTCEWKTLSMNCGSGRRMTVLSANYGRLGRTHCQHSAMSNTNCRSSNSLNVVKARCQGRSSCSVPATNSVFGDPCVGTYKYLEVTYLCQT